MSTETTSKIPTHQPSKRSRAPPPPTKKPSFEENKNGSLSEQEKDVLKKNGSLEDAGGTSSGDERQLSVVLPSEKIVKASVKKDTPILELLIMIASKNKLNPTNHTIAQPAARPKDPPVQLKPTQKLSDVVGDTVYIIRRNQKQVFVYKKDEKKSAVYEPTTRITVISGKNHKMCLRVDPEKTLQELLPVICDERGVETSCHTLRLTSQPQESLDMSQTLEKTGAIEFLLVDLKGQPAGYEGGEVELMPEQRKKKGSIFGKFSKKKKGYALGGGEFQEDPASHVAAPAETHQRSRRHTSPSAFPPLDGQAQSATQEDEEGNNTLKKRRPAPPPPPGKHLTSASDDEKLDEESGGSNTLRKRRAPAPPRPRSPPRRTVSVGADSAHQISANLPPPRPISPPVRTSINGETHLVRETIKEEIVDKKGEPSAESPRQDSMGVEVIVAGLTLETKAERHEEGAELREPEEEANPEEETIDEVSSEDIKEKDKDAKAKMELLSHMMKMSLDEDSKDTNDYPPHTQADDTHDMLEEKSVHALAFEVTREATIDYEDADKSVEALGEETEDVAEVEESQKKVDDEKTESAQMTVEKKEKVDESPTKVEDEKQSPVIAPGGVAMQKLNEQYATLQEQLTALQKQMAMPQQAGIMEIQMQQLQQQILLQQQIISQMMMSPQPMVMPLPYQQPVISPQQQMMLTPQQMMSPQQQMMSQQMISPQQQMMTQQMLSPQQQMMMSPQQLLMTPPMMYPQVSPVSQNITQPKMYAQQITSTATVQAQSTPISSTLELNVSTESAQDDASPIQDDGSPSKDDVSPSKDDGSPSGDDGSPSKHDDVPTEDDLPIVDNVVTSEVDTSEVQAEPRPLSPPVKADEVSVGHPTYHFARSRDVPQGEIKVVKASPPNTLRGPKQHQRPTLLQTPEPSEKKEETEPETKDHSNIDAKTNNAADEVHAEVDANHNPTPEGNGIEDKVDASKTEDKDDASKTEDKVHASKTEDKDDASKTEDKDDASKLEDKVHASKTEDKVHASKTEDKNASEETSSISAFAVAESTEPVSSSKPKSPKQKKSGFSLFKKKTPKYSYILSAQKEFSRKSETERQRTTSNPPKPTDLKSEGGQGNRGRAHTLDSYDPSKASCGVNFDPGQAECQREMAKNVHIPPNLAMSTSEINPSNDQPVIPPRSSKSKTTDTKVIVAKSFPQEMTTGSPSPCPSTTVTNTAHLSNISPINTIPVSSSDEMSSMTKPTPRHRTVSSPVESKTREQTVNKSPKSQPSPSHQVIPELPSEKCSPLSSQSLEVVSLNSPGDSPIPPVRKMHSKPNDTCKTQVIGIEVRPERAATEGALYERRARIHNYRSEEEEQAKVKGDASVSQLRQIFGQGNP
ncbi:titin-like isoform X5 [Patiria miniata]|uniref:Cordon-bleu ubiquitin-like domain-containing protein n=1 Tax=Patiria miniata TaxID=46514 RepID=A0A913YX93_PATMI|nr:titin-like isoform X5 [Patiria miniata]